MADLVIRGMEMPTEQRIEVLIFKNGFVAYYDVEGRYIGQAKAVPLPEGHGRLIDGTDLYAILDGGFDVDLDELPETKDALLCMIQSAETIVPAEGGDEDGWTPEEEEE